MNRTDEQKKEENALYEKKMKNQVLENAPVRPKEQGYWEFVNEGFEKVQESDAWKTFVNVIGEQNK
jgi:hypothetical protein